MRVRKIYDWWAGESQSPIESFSERITTDGGTFEGSTCLQDILDSLGGFADSASLLLTPNGYKSGKIYSYVPTDGAGDFSFTRNTGVATRKKSSGFETLLANVPRIDYLTSSCPSVLLEPARTNLLIRSEAISYAAWSKGQTTVRTDTTDPGLLQANGVCVDEDNDILYVVSYESDCLSAFDVSTPSAPVFLGRIYDGDGGAVLNGPIGCIKKGNYLIVSCNLSNAISVFDVSNPASITYAGGIANGSGGASLSGPWNMDISTDLNTLYVGTNTALCILNITSLPTITHIGSLTNGTGGANLNVVTNVKVFGTFCYCASFSGNALEKVDISTPASPAHSAVVTNGTGGALLAGAHGLEMTADGTRVFVAARTSNCISVFNSTTLAFISAISDGDGGAELTGAESLQRVGNYLHCTCLTGDAYEIVDATNPDVLAHAGKILDGTNGANLDGANRAYAVNGVAYVACNDGDCVEILDVSTVTAPAHITKILNATFNKILETSGTGVHSINQLMSKAASSLSYIYSVVVKANGRDYICLQSDDGTNGAGKYFNISNGTLGNDRTIGTGYTLSDSRIINLGADGYMCMIRVTTNTATALNFRIFLSTDGSTFSYAGDVTKGFYVSRACAIQDVSPFTNSAIRSAAATQARTADAVTALTGKSALIGQAAGTIFFWVTTTWADSVSKCVSISDGTLNNRATINFTTGNVINAIVVSGGATQATIDNAGFSNLTEYKVAVTYQSNKVALFVNGSKIGEDLTVTVPACSRIGFDSGAGSAPFYGNFKAFQLSTTALSDAEAITLTTI